MSKTIDIRAAATYSGKGELKEAARDVENLGEKAKTSGAATQSAMESLGLGIGVAGAAFTALAQVVREGWEALKAGAVLADTRDDFTSLAESVGSTADVMEGKLKAATSGMVSNAQLLADASLLMGTNLGLSESRVVAFAGVAAELDWNLATLTDTLNTKMARGLKELGLNVDLTTARIAELEAAGHSADDAFQLAVLEGAAMKIELVGRKSEETGGKIQALTNIVVNVGDAFKEAFATTFIENLDDMGVGAAELGDDLIYAAEGAAILAASLAKGPTASLALVGVQRQLVEMAGAYRLAGGDAEGFMEANLRAFAPNSRMGLEERRAVLEELKVLYGDLAVGLENADAGMINSARTWRDGTAAMEEAVAAWVDYGDGTDAVTRQLDAYSVIGERAANVNRSIAESTGFTVYELAQLGMTAEEVAELQKELAEASQEAAADMAQAYWDTAMEMTAAFVTALDPKQMPDFGNLDEMKSSAFDMAAAFGLTIPVLGELGVKLGEFTAETAESAAKAAIFQEAWGNILGQLQVGAIDPTQAVAAFNELVTLIEENTLVELQVKVPSPSDIDLSELAGFSDVVAAAMAGSGEGIASQAVTDALSVINGIPGEQTKIIHFDPDDQPVLDAVTTMNAAIADMPAIVTFTPEPTAIYTEITAIDTAISTLPGLVTFRPQAEEVYSTMEAIDGQVLTVTINYVETGAVPGGGGGTSGGGGGGGGTSGGGVSPSPITTDGVTQLYHKIRREGVSW